MIRLAELARLLKVVLELLSLEECAIAENFTVEIQTCVTVHKVSAKLRAAKHHKIHAQQLEGCARLLRQIA